MPNADRESGRKREREKEQEKEKERSHLFYGHASDRKRKVTALREVYVIQQPYESAVNKV